MFSESLYLSSDRLYLFEPPQHWEAENKWSLWAYYLQVYEKINKFYHGRAVRDQTEKGQQE